MKKIVFFISTVICFSDRSRVPKDYEISAWQKLNKAVIPTAFRSNLIKRIKFFIINEGNIFLVDLGIVNCLDKALHFASKSFDH